MRSRREREGVLREGPPLSRKTTPMMNQLMMLFSATYRVIGFDESGRSIHLRRLCRLDRDAESASRVLARSVIAIPIIAHEEREREREREKVSDSHHQRLLHHLVSKKEAFKALWRGKCDDFDVTHQSRHTCFLTAQNPPRKSRG